MSKHSQRPDKSLMTCMRCKNGDCNNCVDVLRMVYTDQTICQCTRKNHSGEPVDQQIADPFTGAIHAPGLTVEPNGEIHRTPSEGE